MYDGLSSHAGDRDVRVRTANTTNKPQKIPTGVRLGQAFPATVMTNEGKDSASCRIGYPASAQHIPN